MWKIIRHYAHAIAQRAELFHETLWLEKREIRLPRGIGRRIWTSPTGVSPYIRLLRFLHPDESLFLIDVGGNTGYWCETFLEFFPKTTVAAFEPVTEAFLQYKKRFLGNPAVRVFQSALSDRQGEAPIHVGESLGRSSLLEYSGAVQKAFRIGFSGTETVPLNTLDSFRLLPNKASKTFLKIDVQGHEFEVLKGSKSSLPGIDAVFVECSFAQEYKEAPPSFAPIVELLVGFDLYPIVFGEHDHRLSLYGWERDVLFVKRPLLDKIWGVG